MEPGLFSQSLQEAMNETGIKLRRLVSEHASGLLGSNSSSKVHVHHLKSSRQFFKVSEGDAGCFVGNWACGGRVGGWKERRALSG